ncbi:LOW QUALITY PROTEIN: uncharacterized protein LOC103519210, partial [Diaphorina citri]|uniref:LOW QUALITY PROTEIN: uncharacterized protein LOC103519210 n=1 Tax=Diaphorina citri TaxID=121845 RepID=A0A3Q0JDT3_DIACI
SDQVDIWTVSSTGCPCASNASSTLCACCVPNGGCQCGHGLETRCVQCGLEQACTSACNMSISALSLQKKSTRSYGQLKSPSLAGPGLCWYSFEPDDGQRVEVQIYRLISVGKFNGSECLGGQVALSDSFNSSMNICGTNERFTPPVVLFVDRGSARLTFQIQESTERSQFLAYFSFTPLNSSHPGVGCQPRGGQRVNNTDYICGTNERFTPPVVLFVDRGSARLTFQIQESTERSQFLAYFSFTPLNSSHPGVGCQPRGGQRVNNTACDWVYHDFSCSKDDSCLLSSPGYPGLYPAHASCSYLITSSSQITSVHIKFLSMSFPVKQTNKQTALPPHPCQRIHLQHHIHLHLQLSPPLQITSLGKLSSAGGMCHTACGDTGCFCVTSKGGDRGEGGADGGEEALKGLDHLKLVNDGGEVVACLCGEFQALKGLDHLKLVNDGGEVVASGASIPPYDYNGFVASIRFTGITTPSEPVLSTAKTNLLTGKSKDSLKSLPSPPVSPSSSMSADSSPTSHPSSPPAISSTTGCEMFFFANASRSGHFDSRSFQGRWSINCTLVFIGLDTDVVHISLFNYVLKAPSCHTFIEFYDSAKPIRKICSPVQKNINDRLGGSTQTPLFTSSHPRMKISLIQKNINDRLGGSTQTPLFTSSHPRMKISLIRAVHLVKENQDEEFLDGAYSFHDQRISGTLQPDTLCNVKYYGLSSPASGTLTDPDKHHLFWNIDHRLVCSSRFISRTNQSVVLSPDTLCNVKYYGLSSPASGTLTDPDRHHLFWNIDHRLVCSSRFISRTNQSVVLSSEWLPVSVRSWSPISLVYSVAHYTHTGKGFTYAATYAFVDDNLCGHHTLEQHSGLIQSSQSVQRSSLYNTDLNYYYNLHCTWLLTASIPRSIYIEFYSEQNKPCASWNVSVHRYDASAADRCGSTLHIFCPRDKVKLFSTNETVAIVKLTAHTTLLPQYSVKYYSKVKVEEESSDVISRVATSLMTSSVQDDQDVPSSVLASRNLATLPGLNVFLLSSVGVVVIGLVTLR